MSSIGSATSFWQQDQNYWSQAQQTAQTQTASDSLITDMGTLMTNQVKGLASIATKEALTRTNNQLTAALKSAIAQTTGSTSSSSNGSSNTPAPATPTEATGTGTVPLLATTSLMALGIPPNSGISVSDGTYTTTYNTTGTDTVGDLINAINNTTQSNNAQVNAYLNTSGNLVISALNNTNSVSVTGLFAQNIGFGPQNDSFSPPPPPSSSKCFDVTDGRIDLFEHLKLIDDQLIELDQQFFRHIREQLNRKNVNRHVIERTAQFSLGAPDRRHRRYSSLERCRFNDRFIRLNVTKPGFHRA